MKRRLAPLFMTALLGTVISSPAFSCATYSARLDLEGKLGSKRDIGEASVFLPVACTPDRLSFSDLRFRADDQSNREGNLGLGARLLKENGIAGGYVYFDRKKSGETDKYYNQITTGAEWLAQSWEVRGNAYIPLTGSKTIGNGIVTSAPYLAGSGIFIDSGGFLIKEKPLYGADIEAGIKIPDTKLWIYGGGFTFHADDVPNVSGVRTRAKYDLTETVSLTAEGQYDGERGRQGWLGARWSIPFGAKTQSQGLQARMTQSPVRDIDVVTQAKTASTPTTTTAVLNADSGDVQRVIYVDNTAAMGGNGTLEKPFNTLSDAQNELADYDVVYVHHGDSTTAGMDQGFVIDKNNVSFIGEGSAFVYDGGRFTAQNGGNYNGFLLKEAGGKPLVTNAAGAGIFVTGANASISGLAVSQAAGDGIRVEATGRNLGTFTLDTVDSKSNAVAGLYVIADTGGAFDAVTIRHLLAADNGTGGAGITTTGGGGRIGLLEVRDFTGKNNASVGIFISAGSPALTGWGTIDRAVIDNVHLIENNSRGFHARSSGAGATFGSLEITNLHSIDNRGDRAVWLEMTSGGVYGSISIDTARVQGNLGTGISLTASSSGGAAGSVAINRATVSGNANAGISISAAGAASIDDTSVRNSDVTGNGGVGIILNDDTTGIFDVTLKGGNRLFGNAGSDLRLDLNGGQVDARNNWWGNTGGAQAGQVISDAAPNDGTADTSDWLMSDPRP